MLFVNFNVTCAMQVVGYTLRHLHQLVVEHKNQCSPIGKHINKYSNVPKDLDRYFSVFKKCMSKFDCLVYEMLLIRELTPSLNVQSDSIQAKLYLRDITYSYIMLSFGELFLTLTLFISLVRT